MSHYEPAHISNPFTQEMEEMKEHKKSTRVKWFPITLHLSSQKL